ncbi:M56 family metallopeptidase [Dyadobacter bucti]|uniref:M56 family metallopeptidase n=1 Tax=Dyadobacter bucti TaxID=2572203 RepID=UPI003F6FA66A
MLIPYLFKVSILLTALTLGYRWLVRFETFSVVNRILLWFNVAASWTLPLAPLPAWGPIKVQTEFHEYLPRLIENLSVTSETKVSPSIITADSSNVIVQKWQLTDWLLAIYFTGLILSIAIFLFQISRLLLRLWPLPAQKLHNGIVLVKDEKNVSPYSFFGRIILNPMQHSNLALQHILAHETEHIRQYHSLDLLAAEFQRILLWFNPSAWFHKKLVDENLEYLADNAVLKNGFEKKAYQIHLLGVTLQTGDLPLTHNFAQSMLKMRIKMMNRQRSKLWASGKYLLLIALLYLSSAFIAPYQDKVIEALPEAIRPVVETLVVEGKPSSVLQKEDSSELKKPTTIRLDSLKSQPDDILKFGNSPWIIKNKKTLYWAISPLATIAEIHNMSLEIRNFAGEMNINSISYDPLQLFITSLNVKINTQGAAGEGGQEEDKYTPVKGYSGSISKNGSLTMGGLPPEPLLNKIETDYQKALELKQENEARFFEKDLESKIDGPFSGSTYTKDYLEGPRRDAIYQKLGFGVSSENTLHITSIHKFGEFYLNGKPTGLATLNTIPMEWFIKLNIIQDDHGKKYFLVYTK